MLKYFTAALTRLSRAQPFDVLAEMAQLSLGAEAVAIVDPAPRPTVIGCSEAAAAIEGAVIEAASAVAPVDPGALKPGALLAGAPLDGPPPFSRVVNLPMVCAFRPVLCMVFPAAPGVDPVQVRRFMDVGRRHLAEHALTQSYRADLKRYITMFEHIERTARIGVWEVDLATGEVSWSEEIARIFEIPAGFRPTVEEFLRGYSEPGRTRLREALQEVQLTGATCDLTLEVVTFAGHRRVLRVIASLQRTAEGAERVAGVCQDVTAQEEANERLWWTANHDTLTGLPNRALFADRFRRALERRRRTGMGVCLALVDVDDFKRVNDTLGHGAGDDLLRLVARRLADAVRTSDTVARTGGDEFSILLEDVAGVPDVDEILERIRAAMDIRLTWDERTMNVTLSGGAALAPDHGESEHALTHAADLALYRMKEEPQAAICLYDPLFGHAVEARSRILAEARQALAQKRFVPFYQPQVDIASGAIVGVEALARWITEDGVREASDFACALEDQELGPLIGRAVVDRALAEIARLNRFRQNKIALSVNASAGELVRASFLERIGRLTRERGIEAGPITVEINEDVILDDPGGRLGERMREATDSGVSFALDDFGIGRASLLHVSTLPISAVKVDRAFVADLETDAEKQRIMRGIIEVARSLDLRLIVEGVETAEQVRCITSLGGRIAQGYFYSRAVPIEELPALLDRVDGRLGNAA